MTGLDKEVSRRITVVIPTYNEAGNIPGLVPKVLSIHEDISVIVVDDNSPDGTGKLADDLVGLSAGRVSVIHREKKAGMGRAYVTGFKRAMEDGADLILQMDADFAHDPSYLPGLIENSGDADVVVGSRYCPGGDLSGLSLPRRLLSRMANAYARTLLGIPIRDVTGGFKCYRRRVFESLDLDRIRSTGFAFQVEILYKCFLRGFRITEFPIVFKDRHSGRSKMSLGIILEGLSLVPRMKKLARSEFAEQSKKNG